MRRRLQLFALAVFVLSVLQAGLARADDVDLRLLVELAFQHSDPADDVTESKVTIYRGGGLRYESRLLFFREESCAERNTFALGEGTPAEVRTLERVLTDARVGQLTGRGQGRDPQVRPGCAGPTGDPAPPGHRVPPATTLKADVPGSICDLAPLGDPALALVISRSLFTIA